MRGSLDPAPLGFMVVHPRLYPPSLGSALAYARLRSCRISSLSSRISRRRSSISAEDGPVWRPIIRKQGIITTTITISQKNGKNPPNPLHGPLPPYPHIGMAIPLSLDQLNGRGR